MLLLDYNFTIANTPLPLWSRCQPVDPGWLYILRNADLFKAGKTTDPKRRLREARIGFLMEKSSGEAILEYPYSRTHTAVRNSESLA